MSDARRPIGSVEANFAIRQHGIVTRAQLRAAGFSDDVIDHRIRSRRLTRIHRGVYLVGVIAPPLAYEMAACLACGRRAVLSHGSAAALWKIVVGPAHPVKNSANPLKSQAKSADGGAHPAVLEVTVPDNPRQRPGIKVYRIGTLRSDEITRRSGIPITTATRTLFDLAGKLPRRQLERAVAEAFALRLVTPAELRAMAERQEGRRGVGRLRAVLDLGAPRRTRSEAEERFLAVIARFDLPPPAVNTRVGGHEIDFYWPAEGLAVEVDGVAFHSSPHAFERDRRRDAELASFGVRVMRVTWRQITREPRAVASRLKRALSSATSGPRR